MYLIGLPLNVRTIVTKVMSFTHRLQTCTSKLLAQLGFISYMSIEINISNVTLADFEKEDRKIKEMQRRLYTASCNHMKNRKEVATDV